MQRPPSKILPWLYLGDKYNASDFEVMKSLHVTHIVNASYPEVSIQHPNIVYQNFEIKDEDDADIRCLFAESNAFISGAKAKGGDRDDVVVFVHCAAGMSRSASLILAYLVGEAKMTLKAAMELMKKARPIATPNAGFNRQLIMYEIEIHGAESVSEEMYYDVDPDGSGGTWIKWYQ